MHTPTDRRPMTGRRLADRYELLTRLGVGGMAEVWEGIDHNLGRRVAVKMLHGHLAAEPNVLTRFRSEAQAAARLTHPGIVGIYDTVTADGTDAIIMELVTGRDLRSILDERPTLAVVDAVEVGVQLAAALGHAHQNGIIHRDIKPANILVRPDRRVKLSDFGIAKALDQTSHTESGSLVGTVKYLAPEQIEGNPVDGRTDLYGLTTVMYEMLCGEVPFVANDLMGAMNRLRKPPPSARKLRPDIPPALDMFLQRGLARNPDDRYDDAATWSASLTEAMRGDAPRANRHPPHRAPERVDPTVVEASPASPPSAPSSIPVKPAPTPPVVSPPSFPHAAAPQAGVGPSGARPVTPRRAPKTPKKSPPTTPPVAKHVKTKRSKLRWLGPLIALALMLLAIATVWMLLNPSNNVNSEPGSAGDIQADDTDTSTSTDSTNSSDDADSTDPAGTASETSSTTESTTTTTISFSNGRRAFDFDPLGDNVEHPEAVSRPFDGDPTSFWLTQKYKTRTFGQLKEGVGIIVEFEEPQRLDRLRILADRDDWSVQIFEADAVSANLVDWGEPIGDFSGLVAESDLDLPDMNIDAMLVWVTDLGLATGQSTEDYDAQVASGEIEQQIKIFELELVG